MICGIVSDAQISGIWLEVAGASTRQTGMALLVQYIITRYDYIYAELHMPLRPSILLCPLYNFVVGDRFVNPRENHIYPVGWGLCPCGQHCKANGSNLILTSKRKLEMRTSLLISVRKYLTQRHHISIHMMMMMMGGNSYG